MSKKVNVDIGKIGTCTFIINDGQKNQCKERKNIIFNLPEPVSPFGGREHELSQIHESFRSYQIVALIGMCGMGKSELAKKYAATYIEHYESNVIWINSEINDIIRKSLECVAEELCLKWQNRSSRDIIQDMYRYFEGGTALIVFDNVIDETFIKSYFPSRLLKNCNIRIIITSQYRKWSSKVKAIELSSFSEDDSINLLAVILGEKYHKCKRDMWANMAQVLHYSPLFLQISAACILQETDGNNPDFTIPHYIEKLGREDNFILDEPFSDYDNRTSIRAMQCTLDKIKDESSLQLIYVCSYFDPDYIDRRTILKILDTDSLDENVARVIRNISQFSLITFDGENIRIHRLVQCIVRYYLNKHNKCGEIYRKALNLIVKESDLCLHRRSVFQYAEKYTEIVVEFYKKNKSYNFLRLLTSYGCAKILKILLDKKPKILMKCKLKKHPLLYEAAASGNLDTLKLIFKYDKNVNQRNEYGWSPLRAAAEGGHENIMKFLLKNKASNTIEDETKTTQLHQAAASGNLEILRFHVDKAKDIDVKDIDGFTPLMDAVLYGHIESSRLLIQKGAKVNTRDEIDRRPLHYAVENDDAEMVELLLKEKRVDLDAQDKYGLSPLHDSAIGGYDSIASLLISHGASVNIKDKEHMTPLHWAAHQKHCQVVRVLLQSENIILDEKNDLRQTALHCAAYSGSVEIIDMLINKGCKPDARDANGKSLLHHAVSGEHYELVKTLLDRYPRSIKEINDDGESVLHFAVQYYEKKTKIARLLLERGADIDSKDVFMRTPFDVANLLDNHYMIGLLDNQLSRRMFSYGTEL
ncbi:Ankyrin 2 [Carabus blaptoides fortunei]